MIDYLNTISKKRRPKVLGTHDFMGSGHSREVTTTSSAMVGIEDFLSFNMGETTMKYNIDMAIIKIITNWEVGRGLM